MSLRLDLDYMTTSEKKKCLLILNLVKAVVMVDYVTTSKKKMFIWILSVRLDLDYTTTSKKKVSIDFERCC